MIVWTIQPYEVYQKILNEGYFYCDPKRSRLLKNGAEFLRAYQWMIQQMVDKIGPAKRKNCYPIWAWYRSRDYKHQRPDFRLAKNYPDEVCIELEISENSILLSDFESWHFVLNDWFNADVKSEAEMEQQDNWFKSLPEQEQQQVKESSWQRIFDITPRYGEWDRNGDVVQACFWSIEKGQIRRAWRRQDGKKVQEIYPN